MGQNIRRFTTHTSLNLLSSVLLPQVLLLLDMLIVMAGITLEIEYLHSKVTDYKDNLYDCILGEGHYTRDPRVVIAYGPNNLTSTIPTTTSTKWSAHFGNEDLHNAELALINISITILSERPLCSSSFFLLLVFDFVDHALVLGKAAAGC